MRSPVLRDVVDERWASMAFCYPTLATGKVGEFGRLTVADIEGHWAVSLGMHGRMTPGFAERARRELVGWLEEHEKGWVDAGLPTRVLGWNSPFVPERRRAWDVQAVVVPRGGGGAAEEETSSGNAGASRGRRETRVGRIG